MKPFIFLLLICILSIVVPARAQKQKKCNCLFQSAVNIGLIEGQRESSFQLQTVNGIAHQKWFAGVGAGLDYYRFRSIPLFFDIRKSFSSKPFAPFIYGDIGHHFTWERTKEIMFGADLKGGLYVDLGVGMQVAVNRKQSLTLSAGYTYKDVTEKSRQYIYCIMGPCEGALQSKHYRLNRLSMKAGWFIRN
ncbi:MAG TPA: hypothetical protein VM012_15565 [Flavitalea sp.]|nr:hypothetical protein [Flavitalea sp.]